MDESVANWQVVDYLEGSPYVEEAYVDRSYSVEVAVTNTWSPANGNTN